MTTNGTPPKPPVHKTEEARFNDNQTHIWGQGTAGNVVGAVGNFLGSGSRDQPAAPAGYRYGGRQGYGPLEPIPGYTAPSGGGSSIGGPGGVGGAVYSPATTAGGGNAGGRSRGNFATGMISDVAATVMRAARGRTASTGTGMQSAAGAGLSSVTGNAVVRTKAQQQALPVTPTRQRAANKAARAQTAEQKAADPHNWAGIARDLGNAGDKRWAQYATGDIASTTAKRLVKNPNSSINRTNPMRFEKGQPLKAPTVAAPKTVKKAARGSKTVRAV